jgi:tetratricopeptide (TPR) repeat protein
VNEEKPRSVDAATADLAGGNQTRLVQARKARRSSKALEITQAAVAANPNSGPAWSNLGVVQCWLGMHAEARESYRAATRCDPTSVEAWRLLGDCHREAGEWKEARHAYEAALGLSPNRADVWNNLGIVLSRSGQAEAALAAFSKVIEIERKSGDTGIDLYWELLRLRHMPPFRKADAAPVDYIDLVALRPIRRKNGTKAVLMPDGTLLEIVPVKFLCGQRPDGSWMGEGHPSYLWRMGFVLALLKAGYKVISAENHVLGVTTLPTDATPLTERRLISEALNARISMGGVTIGRKLY